MVHPRTALIASSLTMAMLAAACTSSSATQNESPTSNNGITVLTNARVYTLNPDQPWAQALAYDGDGILIAVGSTENVLATAGTGAEILDAKNNMILPGFGDVHVHVVEAGINANLCFMSGQDLPRLEAEAAQCAKSQPDSKWVMAAGPSLFDLGNTVGPGNSEELPIDVLDRAIPDRPALILDDLGHAAWTNTLGLRAAGIGPDTPDPQGGVLQRDPASGRLTGLLLENAQQLVRNAAAGNGDDNYAGLLTAMKELNANGITSVSDAGGFWAQNHPAAWERAQTEGTLTVRAANSLYVYPDLDIDSQLAEFESRFDNSSDLLRFDTAKIYIDGILDLGTATLLEPYDVPVDPLYPSGFPYFTAGQLQTYVSRLHQLGYRVSIHAIGDQAIRDGLDAIEAIGDNPETIADRRHRITHTYLVNASDLVRFAQIGVVADFQQSADAIDPAYRQYLSEFIGERASDLLPTAQLLDAGATVTLSSDWDAGPLSPLGTIQRSLTRESNAVPDLETALKLHTINAAYAMGRDEVTGSIEVGKFADFVVLDQNLFEIDPTDIGRTKVLATYLGGQAVYAKPSWGR